MRLWLKPQVRELGIVVKASTESIIDPKIWFNSWISH